ncbi:MAG TPA: lipopolysaccharide biosynthesis protein, partial [Blastocatellia bacterium]|nr:lipopolysaccharide biosynthesis protein [Blastocatellia bacterium]
ISPVKREPDSHTLQTVWLATAKFAALAISFLLPLVVVRKLNQAEFGLYKQSFQILSTVLSLLSLQVGASVYYFIPRAPKKRVQVAFNVLLFYLLAGSAVAISFAVYPQWVTMIFQSNELVTYVPLIGLSVLMWLVASPLEVFMIANGDVRIASAVIIFAHLSRAGLFLSAILAFGNLRTILYATAAHGILQWVVMGSYLHYRYGSCWGPVDWSLLKAQLANALPFGAGAIAYSLQLELHNFFVSHYFSPADFAIYAVGCFQLPLISILLESTGATLTPEVARRELAGDYEGIISVWLNAIRRIAFFFLPACLFLFTLRHEFIATLFTPKYATAAPLFAINLVQVLLCVILIGPLLRAFAEFKYFFLKLNLVLLPVTWVALYLSVQAAGLIGAITVTVCIRLIERVITAYFIGRRLQMSLRDLRHLSTVPMMIVSASLAGLAAFITKLSLVHLPPAMTLLICSVVFTFLYLPLAFMTGAVTDAEKTKLRQML